MVFPNSGFSHSLIEYALNQLLSRADIEISLVNIKYGNLFSLNNNAGIDIFIHPIIPSRFYELLNKPIQSLEKLSGQKIHPSSKVSEEFALLPILFWGEPYLKDLFAEVDDNKLIIFPDIVAATIFMLTRLEETIIKEKDGHDRFPASASVAYKQRFLDRPIIDEYAIILREWLKILIPNWQPRKNKFSVFLSHDIDHLREFTSSYKAIKKIGWDFLRHGNLSFIKNRISRVIPSLSNPENDLYFKSIRILSKLELEESIPSAFYFKTARQSKLDDEYDIGSVYGKRLIKDLLMQGREIGFHAGYNTYNNQELLLHEVTSFEQITGLNRNTLGGRQHYLRFKVPDTWRHWEVVGLKYDSSMGYAEHEGFRCGTCHPFQPYDIEKDRPLNLMEIPLIVMDGVLKQRRKYSPIKSLVRINYLMNKCRRVEGIFTLLWHNSSVSEDWESWFKIYQEFLYSLS
jgi:hypothetical protein